MSLSQFEVIERAGFTQSVISMMVASAWGLCVNDPVEYRSETWMSNQIKEQQALAKLTEAGQKNGRS